MNQIIKSYLDAHIKEYNIENTDITWAFEHFVNKCIINGISLDRFDPNDIMTEKGEIGLDGVAIILNGQLITDVETCQSFFEQNDKIYVKFVFIQAKTSESFDGGEISTFFKGIKHFFEAKEVRPQTNEKMENLINIKDFIYSKAIDLPVKPSLEMYYACCGKWDSSNNLINNVNTDVRFFEDLGDFSGVNFYPYDNDKIITIYKEMRRKIVKSFNMEKRLPFYPMKGVKVAYFGLIKCRDIANLLTDEQGRLFNNIFEDNVRDFQGYNPVNSEIKNSILDNESQNRFSVLNNGITIIAKSIETEGDTITLFDYQIVNGCQTSRVIFDNSSSLLDNSCVLAKIIQVENEDVLDKIVYTSNRQTEVKYEAFSSANHFHKLLQEYYNSIAPEFRLYYERRSKQYDMDLSINKNKVVTLAVQTFSYISMFLNEPHSANRYYGEVLQAYKKRIYNQDDLLEPYYISAYCFYYVDNAIKKGQIAKKYKPFRYHLCCALKALICGGKVCRGNSKEIREFAKKISDLIHDSEKLRRALNTVCTCIDNVIKQSSDISPNIIFRSKDFTNRMLAEIKKFSSVRDNGENLGVGQIVLCQVTAIRDYTIEVEIRTDDSRKDGSIYISNIAKHFINNICDEVQLGELLQAKIISGYNQKERVRGWDLTLILD